MKNSVKSVEGLLETLGATATTKSQRHEVAVLVKEFVEAHFESAIHMTDTANMMMKIAREHGLVLDQTWLHEANSTGTAGDHNAALQLVKA